MKQFALPLVALAVIAGYWLWRSSSPTPSPAAASVAKAEPPPARSSARDPGPPSTTRSDEPAKAPPVASAKPAGDPPRATQRDRARTDGLREQLRTKIGGRSAGSKADDDEAADDELGTLDKDYIQARIREDLLPIAQECYESALEDDPKLGGKLVMKFSIVGDESVGGVVDEADADPSSDIKQPDLLECMKESMLSLSFPPPEGGGKVSVVYPFEFSSDTPAKP